MREHHINTAHIADRQLVEEVPVAITVNELHYSVMLASPHDLEDFAIGYLLSEGVIDDHIQVHDIELIPLETGINLNVVLANRKLESFKHQQRKIKGTSGCGLCGTEAMELAFPELIPLKPHKPLKLQLIASLKTQLKSWQKLAQNSGALHAAFWIDIEGQIVACREDIGRHNAVDKITGHALRKRLSPQGSSILVTSRCSIEIVQKTIKAKVSSLISLASPTQMALNCAIEHGLNLIHIPRQDSPQLLTPGVF